MSDDEKKPGRRRIYESTAARVAAFRARKAATTVRVTIFLTTEAHRLVAAIAARRGAAFGDIASEIISGAFMNDELKHLALSDLASIEVAAETIRRASPPGAQPPAVERAWDQLHRALGALEKRIELLHADEPASDAPAP